MRTNLSACRASEATFDGLMTPVKEAICVALMIFSRQYSFREEMSARRALSSDRMHHSVAWMV